jgi:hypothetical protein
MDGAATEQASHDGILPPPRQNLALGCIQFAHHQGRFIQLEYQLFGGGDLRFAARMPGTLFGLVPHNASRPRPACSTAASCVSRTGWAAAKMSSVGTPTTGIRSASAMPLTSARPMRRLVKDPGPVATPRALYIGGADAAAGSSSSHRAKAPPCGGFSTANSFRPAPIAVIKRQTNPGC